MKLELQTVKEFKEIINLVNLYSTEITFNFKEKLLSLEMWMDFHFFFLEIKKEFFASYDFKDTKVTVKIIDLKLIFDKLEEKSPASIELTENQDELIIKSEFKHIKKKYDLRIIEDSKTKETGKRPELKFDAKILINAEEFYNMLDSTLYGKDKIVIFVNEHRFDITDNEPTRGQSTLRAFKSNAVKIECKNEIQSKYNNEQLKKIINFSKKITENIEINISKDYPLFVYFKKNFISFNYYLAPLIENEDAKREDGDIN